MSWIMANIGTIIVGLVLVCIVALIIIKLVNDRKKGIRSCGGSCAGCAGCAMKGTCHKK